MHILFVHTALPGVRFNSSIAALSAWLRQHGHRTSLLVVPEGVDEERLRDALGRTAAEVVALSFMSACEDLARRVAAAARAALPGARIVAGGAHPTMYPVATLDTFDVDALCVGEGEEPLRAWIEDPSTAHAGILRRGASDPLVRWWAPDVDALPDWDRSLFGEARNEGNRYEVAVGVAFARGFCPYTCTFCGVDAYRRANQQPTKGAMRHRTPERVISEMEALRTTHRLPVGFAAWDEILPVERGWMARFAPLYRERVGVPLAAHARIEQVRPAMVELLVTAGCDYLVLGIETGDEAYRARFLDKHFTNDDVREAFGLLRAAGISTFASFMLGLPYETPQMLAATVRLAREIRPTSLSWKYYTPERGTRLFELVRDRGLLIDRYVDHPFGAREPMIELRGCTRADVQRAERALVMLRDELGGEEATYARMPSDTITLEHRT